MLILSRNAYDAILDHAAADSPCEACGLLAGRTGDDGDRSEERGDGRGDQVHVRGAYPARNAAATPRVTYEIDPAEQLRLMDEIEASGREVVGFYHSHPVGPPRPSECDVAGATWTDYHYLITSLTRDPPFLGAWRWTGTEFVADAVAVR